MFVYSCVRARACVRACVRACMCVARGWVCARACLWVCVAHAFVYVHAYTVQGELYSGAIFMQQLLGWNLYLCVIVILAVTALYTVAGEHRYR